MKKYFLSFEPLHFWVFVAVIKHSLMIFKTLWSQDPFKRPLKKSRICWVPVAHAYNPSSSGGTEQKYLSSKPAQANSSKDPIPKKSITKKGWWSGSRCRP
jgi:hypothetical protein